MGWTRRGDREDPGRCLCVSRATVQSRARDESWEEQARVGSTGPKVRLAPRFPAWAGGWLSRAVAVEAQGRRVGKVTEKRPCSTDDELSSLTFPSFEGPCGSTASLFSYRSRGLARR